MFKLLLSKFEATPVDTNKVMMVVVCLFRPQYLGRLYQVGPFKNFQNKKCSPDPKRCYWFKPCIPKALHMTYCSCTWSRVAMFRKVLNLSWCAKRLLWSKSTVIMLMWKIPWGIIWSIRNFKKRRLNAFDSSKLTGVIKFI